MLKNDVNSKVNFQKMWVPFFMFYSKHSCGRHMNSKFSILMDFAEGCIGKYVNQTLSY